MCVKKWLEGQSPIINAQNSDLSPVSLHDKVALKGVIWCCSISIMGCLSILHSTLSNQEVILGELVYATELLSLLYQTCRKRHNLSSFLNRCLGGGLGNSFSILFLKTIPLATDQRKLESSKDHLEYVLWLSGLTSQGSPPPTGKCQGFKRCYPALRQHWQLRAALKAHNCLAN